MRTIASRHNQIVREFRALADTPDPAGARFLLDGVHLVRDARAAGITLDVVAVAAARLDVDSEESDLAHELERDGTDVVAAADSVFAALTPVKTPSGIAAIGRRTPTAAREICSTRQPFIVAAVDVQDPGNLGSIVRAGEAAGVTGMFVTGVSANPFSWKALRGSMGSALRLPIVTGLGIDAVLTCMTKSGLRTIASVARGGLSPDDVDWRGGVGLFLGGEGPGLPDALVARCDQQTTIPMAAAVESLNVAVAAGVLAYAARRQRT
jgi:RNA methyltransferase, TrmH family